MSSWQVHCHLITLQMQCVAGDAMRFLRQIRSTRCKIAPLSPQIRHRVRANGLFPNAHEIVFHRNDATYDSERRSRQLDTCVLRRVKNDAASAN